MDFKKREIFDFSIKGMRSEALVEHPLDYDSERLLRAEVSPEEPFLLEHSEGKKYYDLVGYQDTANFAISEKFYSLLVKNEVTGWKTYNINIKNLKKKYYGFQVTGRCSKLIEPKEKGFYTGYKFDFETWDGSDFFTPIGTTIIFCTKKVLEIVQKNRVSNIEMTNIDSVKSFSFGY